MSAPGVILCEYSGEVAGAMRDRGLSAWSCDLLPGERPRFHIQDNALTALSKGRPTDGASWKYAGLHWPCTWFTNAGVKWMYAKGHSRNGLDQERARQMRVSADGLCQILNRLLGAGIPFYFENPIMHYFAADAISQRCRWFADAPRQIVQPWMFGTWETKATCLWLHKLPPLVPTYKTREECRIALGLPAGSKPHAKVHLMSPGANRGHERSRTLPTLAKAMAEQWGPHYAATQAPQE
jgi:hypothetical protein